MRIFGILHNLRSDIRYGARLLVHSPGFTAVVILTLSLGIGVNVALFSVVDPLLLRKLPVRNPDELFRLSSAGTLGSMDPSDPDSELSTYHLYRDHAEVLSGVLAFAPLSKPEYEVRVAGQQSLAVGEAVSSNFFDVLGLKPALGSFFSASGFASPASDVVLSFDYWKRVSGGDRTLIGKPFAIADRIYTIAGVAPPSFFGGKVGEAPDFFLSMDGSLEPEDAWRTQWVTIIGRLKPSVSPIAAEQALTPLFQEAMKASPVPEVEKQEFMARLLVIPASRGVSGVPANWVLAAKILMAIVIGVLLIACANAANLIVARGAARRRELAVRAALGARRSRLMSQTLTEVGLLVLASSLVALILGAWLSGRLVALLSSSRTPIVIATALDLRLFVFLALTVIVALLVCGLIPALSASGSDLTRDLKSKLLERVSSRSSLAKALVTAQVAISVVLLVGAALLLHSFINLQTFDPGFDRDHILLVSLQRKNSSGAQSDGFYDQLLEQMRHLSGVRSASYSGFAPISGRQVAINVVAEGQPGQAVNESFAGVSPGYFRTMGIPFIAGRDFSGRDLQQPAASVILNRSMAHRFFGNENPLGMRIRFVEGKQLTLEVVGVVADSKYNDLREQARDFFYIPMRRGLLEIRTVGNPVDVAGSVRQLIHSLDSSVTVLSTEALQEQIAQSLNAERISTSLSLMLGFLALILTCLGLYGLLSFIFARRISEITVRIALGATRGNILRLVISDGMRLTAAGMLVGAIGGVGCSYVLKSALFGVAAIDPIAFFAVLALLTGAAILACLVPAWRAVRIAPVEALRYE